VRRPGQPGRRTHRSPTAAGIFLDIFDVFLLAPDLFGGRQD
jgi:hypothetical protein